MQHTVEMVISGVSLLPEAQKAPPKECTCKLTLVRVVLCPKVIGVLLTVEF